MNMQWDYGKNIPGSYVIARWFLKLGLWPPQRGLQYPSWVVPKSLFLISEPLFLIQKMRKALQWVKISYFLLEMFTNREQHDTFFKLKQTWKNVFVDFLHFIVLEIYLHKRDIIVTYLNCRNTIITRNYSMVNTLITLDNFLNKCYNFIYIDW